MWDKKGASSQKLQSLDELLRDCPQLLANWGMIGRKMPIEEEAETHYELEETGTLLNALKQDLLFFEQPTITRNDASIRCVKTGASRFQEIQWLYGEIRQLLTEGIDCSQIRVYAPDISLYAPIIAFVFEQIPFRISNVDLARQSGCYQAILQLFRCVKGRWEARDILEIFHLPAFYRKRKWGAKEIERLQEWIEMGGVRWGIDGLHKQQTTNSGSLLSEQGSWDSGWNQMLDSLIYFRPQQEIVVGWEEIDLFAQFYETFAQLQKTLLSWKEEKTLANWAKELNSMVLWALDFDAADQADVAAKNAWDKFIEELYKTAEEFSEETFPFSWVETHFFSSSEEEGRSMINAVRFSSLKLGTMVPSQVLFLIGMDEESFPRVSTSSSLQSLLKDAPRQSDLDRYLFLQAIFCAKKQLIFSYGDSSKEDGKPMSASLLLQELFSYLDSSFLFPGGKKPSEEIVMKEGVVKPLYMTEGSLLSNTTHIPDLADLPSSLALQELTQFFRNPPQYYAKRVLGIDWRKEPESLWGDFELSSLDRAQMIKGSLKEDVLGTMPLGMFGDLAKKNLLEDVSQYREHLQNWGIASESISPVRLDGFLQGEIPYVVPGGILHFGTDDIGGLFRKWPELLAALEATGTHNIYCLRTGKIREIADPSQALQAAINLYLRCRKSLCFLHAEWTDAILRKKIPPNREEVKDPVLRWMLERSPEFDLEQEVHLWQDLFAHTFSSLIQLFPVRGQHAEV
jgi:exodeoxyribonuclease V gamma subunit